MDVQRTKKEFLLYHGYKESLFQFLRIEKKGGRNYRCGTNHTILKW